MSRQEEQALLRLAGDSERELPARVEALQQIAHQGDDTWRAALKRLLERQRPVDDQGPKINWDRQAAERVVDLHIIRALHAAGDASAVGRIAGLVRNAGKVLQGPDDERQNAALVIRQVGHVDVVHQMIELATDPDESIAFNGVKTLQLLELPQVPVDGPVPAWEELTRLVTFTITTLKQELETVARLSGGRIALSSGTRDSLERQDYERGEVRRDSVSLVDFLEYDLGVLGFTYYVDGETVTVCTYTEAGRRWQEWWKRHGVRLVFDNAKGRFTFSEDVRSNHGRP